MFTYKLPHEKKHTKIVEQKNFTYSKINIHVVLLYKTYDVFSSRKFSYRNGKKRKYTREMQLFDTDEKGTKYNTEKKMKVEK